MNKNTLVGITIATILALVIAGWGYFTLMHTAPNTPESKAVTPFSPTKAPPPTAPASSGTKSNPTSFKSVLTQKGNYECDYEQVSNTGKSHNVIYISGGKLRAEFRSTMAGSSGANLSVYDGHYLYTWREGTAVGTRAAITSLGQLPTAIPKDLTSGTIYGDNYNSVGWQCHTWLVDKTILTPPSYMTFK